MKRIITLLSILLFAWTLSAQVKLVQVERSSAKWHIPVAKRVIPGAPGFAMTYMELQHLMDSLGLAAAADSIYLSNDTIFLRDGSGFVVIPEQTNPDSIYLSNDTIYLRDGSGFVKLPGGGGGTVNSVGLATGTGGTDINVTGSPITTSGTFTLNIPDSGPTSRGALTSADWNLFNNKLGGSGVSPRIAFWNGTNSISSTSALRNQTTYLYTGYSEGIHIDGSSASYASGIKFRNNGHTHCSFGLKGPSFVFSNTQSNSEVLWPTPTDRMIINMSTGVVNIPNLAGTGTRVVTASNTGDLSTTSNFIEGTGVSPRIAFWNGTNSISSTSALRNQTTYLYTGYDDGIHIDGSSASYASGIKFRNNGHTHCSFGLKGASFVFSNTSSNGEVLWPTPTDRMIINMNTGVINIPNLAGTGTRIAASLSSGDLTNINVGTGLSVDGTTLNVADQSATNELQTLSTSGAAGNVQLSNGGGNININVNDADASTTNELITAVTSMGLSAGGNTIVITEAGTSRTGVIPPMTGATAGAAGIQGVVPAPAAGNQNKFLRGDGTWQDAGSSLSGTTGYIPYFNSSTTLAPSAVSFRSDAIFGIGFGLAPASITSDIHLGTGKQLEFDGTATIIDKNNSGGGADEILTRAATGGGLDWRGLGLINGQSLLNGDITINSGITGTGSAGRVAFWTGVSTQSNSNNLFWDNSASRLGIGTLTPSRALDNAGASRLRGAIYDSADSPGTTGQVLTSNGAGAWTWNTPFQNQEVILDNESSYSTTVSGAITMTYGFSVLNTGTFNVNLANGTVEVTEPGYYDLSFNGYFGSTSANLEPIYFQYSTNGGSTWLDFPDAIQGRISPGTSTQSLYSNYMTSGYYLNANTLLRVVRGHIASTTFYHRLSYFKVKRIR